MPKEEQLKLLFKRVEEMKKEKLTKHHIKERITARRNHDVYYDGESHYYIDGSVYKGGKLLLLAYDEENEKYYQVENGRMVLVNPIGI